MIKRDLTIIVKGDESKLSDVVIFIKEIAESYFHLKYMD